MDFTQFVTPVFGAVMAIIGWVVRILWQADKEVREDLAKLRESLPIAYVQKEDYRRDIYEIKQGLERILNKLDQKADK